MPNFTNLPERHFVDKAKKLSFGDQDKDTYFDGDTLNAMLEELTALKSKKLYRHLLYDSKYNMYFEIYSTSGTPCSTYADAEALQSGDIPVNAYHRVLTTGQVISFTPYFIYKINLSNGHVSIFMYDATKFMSTSEFMSYTVDYLDATTRSISDTVTLVL